MDDDSTGGRVGDRPDYGGEQLGVEVEHRHILLVDALRRIVGIVRVVERHVAVERVGCEG
jgi:hypothetical protein